MPALKKEVRPADAGPRGADVSGPDRGGGISLRGARQEVGELLGVNESTLRNWIRRDLGEGVTPAAGTEAADEEVTRLRRENAQLRRANEILKTASAFFAAAELDRKLGS